ncbi:MAG: hypothetical protein GEV12_14260 [Micromonosporaceae bacterium]|nr:hypothetical protein [Micromonosporaceae bacterium]
MGTRGPVPNRSDQRRRRNKPEVPVSTAPAGALADREPGDEAWHPIALRWYEGLALSGQSAFYQRSDWDTALYVAEAMSRNLQASRFSAQLFAAVMSATSSLLATEGDRRRLRIELERAKAKPDGPNEVVTELDEYRRRASAG